MITYKLPANSKREETASVTRALEHSTTFAKRFTHHCVEENPGACELCELQHALEFGEWEAPNERA